ncbi:MULTISPECIES: hypothetical protein [unclassified Ruegeria]|uniref:hypothetical protein n=1 Tax=unclassified Ruegeria TaxID=2625375 RepID=UPI0014888B92|nr:MULTISPECIES: hypothetical protein [unclassified Ruegeria]
MTNRTDLLEEGLAASSMSLRDQVKTWENYTDEKADVAKNMMLGVKSILRGTPADYGFRSLSIGSSEEPQLKLLHALSDGGLWLYDKDPAALRAVNCVVERHMLEDIHLEVGDYLTDFRTDESAQETVIKKLGGQRFDLITLHHSLYYSEPAYWPELVNKLGTHVLREPGMMHMVLMSSSTGRPHTTTWLYNHFANKFLGHSNSQNLLELPAQMQSMSQVLRFSAHTSATRFRPNSFREMMAVVWMIMLFPDVHNFDLDQRTEITEFVLDEFWLPRRDIIQIQDYLTAVKTA